MTILLEKNLTEDRNFRFFVCSVLSKRFFCDSELRNKSQYLKESYDKQG